MTFTRLMNLMNKRSSEISTMPAAGRDDAVAILKRDSAELDAFFRKILSAPDLPVAEPMELKAELEEIRGRRG